MTAKETTSRKIFDELFLILKDLGNPEEQKSRLSWLLEEELNITRASIISNSSIILEEEQWQDLYHKTIKLSSGIPIQHIIGKSYFYGREFKVNPDVLIPRPETEELVHLIIKENKGNTSSILDIGTGTGCIPITLKLEMPSAEVSAIDVCKEALTIAKKNAKILNAEVHFFQQNIFNSFRLDTKFDVIVSNPPYIPLNEKQEMQIEVLKDPHVALFVPDENPLIFYNRIADIGKEILNEGGKLYFEIHSKFGAETISLLQQKGYRNIRLIKDINNKDRIIAAQL